MNEYYSKHPNCVYEAYSKINLICIGLGGAGQIAIDGSLAGLASIHLIDPKKEYSTSNVETQHMRAGDVGISKTDSISAQIKIKVAELERKIEVFKHLQKAQEVEFKTIINQAAQKGLNSILMINTDNYEAQHYCYKIAWELGVDSISSQSYNRGLAGEVTFTIGQETVCQGCLTMQRQEKLYTEEKDKTAIPSDGGHIFSAVSLNGLCLKVLHWLVMRKVNNTENDFYLLAERYKNRNRAVLVLHPDANTLLGCDLGNNGNTGEFWEANELEPDPNCLICGGAKRQPS